MEHGILRLEISEKSKMSWFSVYFSQGLSWTFDDGLESFRPFRLASADRKKVEEDVAASSLVGWGGPNRLQFAKRIQNFSKNVSFCLFSFHNFGISQILYSFRIGSEIHRKWFWKCAISGPSQAEPAGRSGNIAHFCIPTRCF
jgi:hypothetical protein